MKRATLSVEETAEVLGIGRNSAYEGVRTGQIPSIRIGKRILVPRIALERILENAGKSARRLDRLPILERRARGEYLSECRQSNAK